MIIQKSFPFAHKYETETRLSGSKKDSHHHSLESWGWRSETKGKKSLLLSKRFLNNCGIECKLTGSEQNYSCLTLKVPLKAQQRWRGLCRRIFRDSDWEAEHSLGNSRKSGVSLVRMHQRLSTKGYRQEPCLMLTGTSRWTITDEAPPGQATASDAGNITLHFICNFIRVPKLGLWPWKSWYPNKYVKMLQCPQCSWKWMTLEHGGPTQGC